MNVRAGDGQLDQDETAGHHLLLKPGGHKFNFFSVSFFFIKMKRSLNWTGGQINDPWSGKTFSLPFLPETPSSPSQTLKGFLEVTRRSIKVSRLTSCIASAGTTGKQGHFQV